VGARYDREHVLDDERDRRYVRAPACRPGKLDIDSPVATYWPEFAQGGKGEIPVRYLLSHQAGLPAPRNFLPPGMGYVWEPLRDALAEAEPWWEPGTRHGYHAVTFGHLVGEVIRRISGMTVGEYFRKEIAEPLDVDFASGSGLSTTRAPRT
jgi:CubicO group peptidase (beta-lactamase class C family)